MDCPWIAGQSLAEALALCPFAGSGARGGSSAAKIPCGAIQRSRRSRPLPPPCRCACARPAAGDDVAFVPPLQLTQADAANASYVARVIALRFRGGTAGRGFLAFNILRHFRFGCKLGHLGLYHAPPAVVNGARPTEYQKAKTTCEASVRRRTSSGLLTSVPELPPLLPLVFQR